MSQAPGAITKQHVKAVNATVRCQTALDNAAVRQWINVAAGQHKDDFSASEFRDLPAQQRCQSSGAGAFNDAFFQFGQAQDCQREIFFLDLNHPMNQRSRDGEGVPTGFRHGQSIGKCVPRRHMNRFTRIQSGSEASGIRRFDADDLQFRFERVQHRRHARLPA